MPSIKTLALAVTALATAAIASDVHALKSDEFRPFVQENPLVLAEFYAPWW
jgi:protein disulfide-isomerase A1